MFALISCFSFFKKQNLGYIWFLFLHMFLKTVYENPKNIILVFYKTCSYSLNLIFFMFSNQKKKKKPTVFSYFLSFPWFLKQKTVFKNRNNRNQASSYSWISHHFCFYFCFLCLTLLQYSLLLNSNMDSPYTRLILLPFEPCLKGRLYFKLTYLIRE